MLGIPSIFNPHISTIYVHFLAEQIIQAYGYKYYLYANDSQVYIIFLLKKRSNWLFGYLIGIFPI